MKKFFCVLVCICFILMCGCSKKSSGVTAVTTGLEFTAEIEYGGEQYIYKVEIPENKAMRMQALAPEKLKGTVLEFSGSSVKIEYDGLSYSTELSALPHGTIISFIYSVFSDAYTKKDNVTERDDEFIIEGEVSPYEYELHLGTTGLPIKIEDEKNKITVIIKNATIINS